jgi:hypothetical protein
MAKKSIQPILQKQQQDSLSSIAETLKETIAIHNDQLTTLKTIESNSGIDKFLQTAQLLEERKVQQDEDESLEIVKETNSNINEMKGMIADQYLLQVEQLDTLTNIEKIAKSLFDSLTISKEDKAESDRAKDEQTNLLETIANNTTPGKIKKEESKLEGGFGPLGILTGLAAAIGSIVGIITAYVKTLKFFTPEFIKSLISKPFTDLGKFIEEVVLDVKSVFSSVIKSVKAIIENEISLIKEIFSSDSKAGSLFKSIQETIGKFLKPFEEAFEAIKTLVSGPTGKIVETIKGSIKFVVDGISKFAKAFGFMAELIGKIAFPIMIITTLYDTITAAIDGYEKGGILGAIQGAIEGFFESLIVGPLDMLREAAAWVAEKFGFDNVAKALESFTFEDIFGQVVDGFTSVVELIGSGLKKLANGFLDLVSKFYGLLGGIGIPEVTLDLPDMLGGPIKIGPWYPYKGISESVASLKMDEGETKDFSTMMADKKAARTATKIEKEAPKIEPEPITPKSADSVYNKSNENAEAKENKSSGGNTVISAPTVNTSNKTVQNQSVKLPTRNTETTSNRYISSRYAIQ